MDTIVVLKKKNGENAENNVPETDTAHALSRALAGSDHEEESAANEMNEKFKSIKRYLDEE